MATDNKNSSWYKYRCDLQKYLYDETNNEELFSFLPDMGKLDPEERPAKNSNMHIAMLIDTAFLLTLLVEKSRAPKIGIETEFFNNEVVQKAIKMFAFVLQDVGIQLTRVNEIKSANAGIATKPLHDYGNFVKKLGQLIFMLTYDAEKDLFLSGVDENSKPLYAKPPKDLVIKLRKPSNQLHKFVHKLPDEFVILPRDEDKKWIKAALGYDFTSFDWTGKVEESLFRVFLNFFKNSCVNLMSTFQFDGMWEGFFDEKFNDSSMEVTFMFRDIQQAVQALICQAEASDKNALWVHGVLPMVQTSTIYSLMRFKKDLPDPVLKEGNKHVKEMATVVEPTAREKMIEKKREFKEARQRKF